MEFFYGFGSRVSGLGLEFNYGEMFGVWVEG